MGERSKNIAALFNDSRSRVIIVVTVVALIVGLVFAYFGFTRSSQPDVGGSAIVGAPSIKNIPGSANLSPEYLQTLEKYNQQQYTQAAKTGSSTIPTFINTPEVSSSQLNFGNAEQFGQPTKAQASSDNCCANCCCDSDKDKKAGCEKVITRMLSKGEITQTTADTLRGWQATISLKAQFVANLQQLLKNNALSPSAVQDLTNCYEPPVETASSAAIKNLLASGGISQATANDLLALNSQHLSPEEYKKALDKLVQEGKLTPDQAKALLNQYASPQAGDNYNALQDMVTDAGLSPNAAQLVHGLQMQNLSRGDYQKQLAQLVKEGKLTPEQAKALLSSYVSPDEAKNNANIDKLLAQGDISPTTANQLKNLQQQGLSKEAYAAALQKLVAEGKLSPAAAQKLLNSYVSPAQAHNQDMLDALTASGKLSPAAAEAVSALMKSGLSKEQLAQQLQKLVAEGKLSPEAAKALMDGYVSPAEAQNESALQGLIASGQISPEAASAVSDLQKQGLSKEQYADALKRLVAEGKLSPEAAAKLLNDYTSPQEASNDAAIDSMLQSGEISPAAASQLKALQKQGLSKEAYAAQLQKLVNSGLLSPEAAKKLLAGYQEPASVAQNTEAVKQLEASGQLSSDTARALLKAQQDGATKAQYAAVLNKLVREGKLTPEAAQKLLADYKTAQVLSPEQQALNDMLASGTISPAAAKELEDAQAEGLSKADYAAKLNELVREGKLTPAAAKALLDAYKAVDDKEGKLSSPLSNDLNQMLATGKLSPNDAKALAAAEKNPAKYAALLRQLVKEGKLTPEEAKRLLEEQEGKNPPPVAPKTESVQLTTAQAAIIEQTQKDKLSQITSAMAGAASALFSGTWGDPPKQALVLTATESDAGKHNAAAGEEGQQTITPAEKSTDKESNFSAPLVKAGTIMFAVLDTEVNSDVPGPVMATIVDGPFKGATLLGSLTHPDARSDIVTLAFQTISRKDWPKNLSISANAINAETARLGLASHVDSHFWLRYGTLFASSFLSGIAQAVQQSGAQMQQGGLTQGNTVTFKDLNTEKQIIVGLGNVGTALSNVVAQKVNTPTTVIVNTGTGIGVMFTDDLSTPNWWSMIGPVSN